MSTQSKQVLKAVLDLPPVERAALVEEILASFDFPSREQTDSLWAKEAEDRIDAHERGEIRAVPASQVFERINKPKSS